MKKNRSRKYEYINKICLWVVNWSRFIEGSYRSKKKYRSKRTLVSNLHLGGEDDKEDAKDDIPVLEPMQEPFTNRV